MLDRNQINLIHSIFTDISRSEIIAVQMFHPDNEYRLNTVIAVNLKVARCTEIYINFQNISQWRLKRFEKLKSKVTGIAYIKTFDNITRLGFTAL